VQEEVKRDGIFFLISIPVPLHWESNWSLSVFAEPSALFFQQPHSVM